MKHIKTILFLCLCTILCARAFAQDTAILVVHFGTTFDDTRHKTLDAITQAVANEFPQHRVAEAYSSPTVVRKLGERGIVKLSPRQTLIRLAAEGAKRVVIQPSFMLDGIEMTRLREEIERLSVLGIETILGRPLLYTPDDCRTIVHAIADHLDTHSSTTGKPSAQAKNASRTIVHAIADHLDTHSSTTGKPSAQAKNASRTIILVGHGTETPATAIYPMVEHIAHGEGLTNMFVGTIEGYPSLDDLVVRLQTARTAFNAKNAKRKTSAVILLPFMLVAGDHANNDIATEWADRLAAEGYEVQVHKQGLGELSTIQQLILNRLHDLLFTPNDASTR